MKLYGYSMSTCTRKVLTLLAEKTASAELVIVDITKGAGQSPEHLARQPFGQVPVLDDDGFVLYESRAILRYLDRKLPGVSLMPSDPQHLAVVEQWISVETSNFTPHAMAVIVETVFNRAIGKEPDMARVEAGRKGVARTADIMNDQLAKTPFIAGATFTVADIVYMPYIEYLYAGGAGNIIDDRSHVARWWKAISSRPSWKTATGKAS